MHRTTQEPGKPAISETTNLPAGRQVGDIGNQRRIEDVTEAEDQAQKTYEEKMEDEYAKREGGA